MLMLQFLPTDKIGTGIAFVAGAWQHNHKENLNGKIIFASQYMLTAVQASLLKLLEDVQP